MSHEIEFIPSPNFSSRKGTKVDTVVIHYTASMNIDGTISWFKNPESKVSAHYIIGVDGRIVQMVAHADKAWHAGKSEYNGRTNVNKFSIGIEIVATKDSGYTEEQYNACAYVCSQIEYYSNEVFLYVGHEDIAPNRKVDPGPLWKWDTFHKELSNHRNTDIGVDPIIPSVSNVDIEDDPESHIPSGKDEHWFEKLFIEILKIFGIEE